MAEPDDKKSQFSIDDFLTEAMKVSGLEEYQKMFFGPLHPPPRQEPRDRSYAYGITPEHLAKWVTAILEIGDILPLMVLRPDGSVDHMDLMKQHESGAIGIAQIPAAALREISEDRIDEMVQEVASQLESEIRIRQQPRGRIWFDELS